MHTNGIVHNKEEKSKLKIPVLKLSKIGPRKIVWTNFEKVCNVIKRNPDTVMKYFFGRTWFSI